MPGLGLAHDDPVAVVAATFQSRLAAEADRLGLARARRRAASSSLGGVADEEAELAAAGRDLADRGCRRGASRARISSSIASSRWRATSPVSASSSRWLPPARSRPRLIVHRLRPARQLRDARRRQEARHREQHADQAEQGDAPDLPAGKFSIGLVVRRLGAVRADVAQHRLDHADPDALRDLELDLVVVDLGDLADQAAVGDRGVARLDRRRPSPGAASSAAAAGGSAGNRR